MAVSSTTGGLKTGVCLSTDRPDNPFNGQVIYETDTNRTLVWDNSAWVVIHDPSLMSYSGTGVTVTADAATIGGENVTPYTGRKNFLINGSMLIAQRATSASQTQGLPGYKTVDRWTCTYQDAATATVSQNTVNSGAIGKSLKITVTSSGVNDNSIRFQQALETVNVIPLQGKTVTLSAYIKKLTSAATVHEFGIQWQTSTPDYNGFGGWSGQDLVNVTSQCTTGSWVRVSRTLTVPANAISLAFTFGCQSGSGNATDVCEITNIQLELGDKATPFEHRSFGEELALCQRYYQRNLANGDDAVASGVMFTTTLGIFSYTFPKMRVAPTITFVSGGDVVTGGAVTAVASSAIGASETQTSTTQIGVTTSALTAGHGAVLRLDNNYFELSAEL